MLHISNNGQGQNDDDDDRPEQHARQYVFQFSNKEYRGTMRKSRIQIKRSNNNICTRTVSASTKNYRQKKRNIKANSWNKRWICEQGTHRHSMCAHSQPNTRSFETSSNTRMRPRKRVRESNRTRWPQFIQILSLIIFHYVLPLRFVSLIDGININSHTPVQALVHTRIYTLNAVCVYNIVHIIKSGHVFFSPHVCFCSAAVFVEILHFYAIHTLHIVYTMRCILI